MNKVIKVKKVLCSSVASLFLAVCIIASSVLSASAEMVNVYNYKSPELTMANIGNSNSKWIPSGKIVNQSGGNYTFNTNAWAFWENYDSLDFAYKYIDFNTGKGSVLTIETTIDSWNGTGTGSVGIHIRTDLSSPSTGIYFCIRPGEMYFMYRSSVAAEVNRGTKGIFDGNYPFSMRVVLDKSKRSASAYYKAANKSSWTLLGNAKYTSGNHIYAGIAMHSVDKNVYSVTECSNLSMSLDAPEGYTIEDDASSSETSSGETSSSTKVDLPDDDATIGDALLYETFTDQDMFPIEQSVNNPLWTIRKGTANVAIDSAAINASLYINPVDDPLVMTAGDFNWTDYTAQMEFYIPSSEVMQGETNTLALLLRHKSVIVGGSYDYGVYIKNEFKSNDLEGQYLYLGTRTGTSSFIPSYSILQKVKIADASMIEFDKTHTIKVSVFDNIIDIYLDGELKISYTDVSANINLTGCIGVYAENASAYVDNILVRKLNDPLGGDYDNEIAGNFDQPIPDYIKQKYGKQ